MRGFLFLVALGLVAAGAIVTRPSHGLHRGVAAVLLEQGRVSWPDIATGAYTFDDFVVATRSVMRSSDRELLECWGAFTRFLCTGAPPQVPARVSS